LANAFVVTTRGVPQLYYGDEIAMTGPDEPTTRADFPGGFPGDKRNAFTKEGRTREEQDVFDYVRKVAHLHSRLESLKLGSLVNLYVSEQQYAYARVTQASSVVTVINNDTNAAEMEFDVSRAGLANANFLEDRLGVSKDVRLANGRVKVKLPPRSAVIFVKK